MNQKILYVASTYSHIRHFHLPYITALQSEGYEVDVMVNIGDDDVEYLKQYRIGVHNIPFEKSMFSIKNFILCYKIKAILEKCKYEKILVHTSLAAFFVRIAALLTKESPYIVNTVHGYLFDEDTKLFKKSILILAEKITQKATNRIIVMNHVDYQIAKKYNLTKEDIKYIDGMGVDFKQFGQVTAAEKQVLRQQYGYTADDFILIYTAEFSVRKNQIFLIRCIEQMKSKYSTIKLIFLGNGKEYEKCKQFVEDNNLESYIHFYGYVEDTASYYQLADIAVSASRIEGLPFNVIEGMYCGLPIVATNIKGHQELVSKSNGYLYAYNNKDEFISKVEILIKDRVKNEKFSQASIEHAKCYAIDRVFKQVKNALIGE